MNRKVKDLYPTLLLLAIQIIIFILVFLSSNFYYQTNDDTTMIALASGAYGTPSIYLDNIHVFLSYLFVWLFTYFPVINWITVFFLICLFCSFFSIDILVNRYNESIFSFKYITTLIIVEVCWFISITYFTFTIVAYICGIAGLLNWIYALIEDDRDRKLWIIGAVFICLCTLIRAEVLKSLILIIIPILIYWTIQNKLLVKKCIFIVCITLGTMTFMTFIHTAIYNMNDIQGEFWEWGEIRSAALDCAPVDFESHQDDFQNIGVDENIYKMIYNQYYFDYNAVSKEIFKNLQTMNSTSEKYNFDFLSILKSILNVEDGPLFYEQFYRCILIGVGLFAIIISKNLKKDVILLFLSTLSVTVLFYFLNRPVYRVIMPNYIFSTLIILILLSKDIKNDLPKFFKLNSFQKISCTLIFMLPIMTITSYCYFNPVQSLDKATRHNVERQQIYKYLEKNNEKLYLSGNLSVYSIDVCRPIFEFAGKESYWNLVGNWETFSVPYYNLMSNYNVKNPDRLALEIADSETLRIISNQGLDYIEFAKFFTNYIEKITGREVKIVPEDYIATLPDGEWWTFRLEYIE